jgi:hypothetical protein
MRGHPSFQPSISLGWEGYSKFFQIGFLAAICAMGPRLCRARDSQAEVAGGARVELAGVQSLLNTVHSPDPKALAQALDVPPAPEGGGDSRLSPRLLQEVGDLDADGTPEYAFSITAKPETGFGGEGSEGSKHPWSLFLLSWDGKSWRASRLLGGFEPYSLQVLPGGDSRRSKIAVIIESAKVPYPVIFDFQDHAASLVWDSRSEESRYQGYRDGQVEFRDSSHGPQMIETGRADPGFLIFPPEGGRGFDARSIYAWDGKAFVPLTTEYEVNPDFLLYRFISALHLHDFRSAYALIDPRKFLKTDQPTLEVFRQHIQDELPEFLDDQIFEAQDSDADTRDIELKKAEKVFVYHPTFSSDSELRLTSLERREVD